MAKKSRRARNNTRAKRFDDGDTGTNWRQASPRVHTFTRVAAANDIPKSALDVGQGVAFRLSDLPAYGEFQNIFDQYRINWVDYIFVLKSPVTAGTPLPILYYAEDHDSDTAPALADIVQAQNVQIITFGTNRTMVKLRVKPNALRQVYRSALTTGYERAPNGVWLDCYSAYDVPHYGVKYFIQNYNSTTADANIIDVVLRYNVSFKETI